MATFEILNLNNVPHLHIELDWDETTQLIQNPFTFLASSGDPTIAGLLNPNMPVNFRIFTYGPGSGVRNRPNVCDPEDTPIEGNINFNEGAMNCACITLGVVESSNTLQLYTTLYP